MQVRGSERVGEGSGCGSSGLEENTGRRYGGSSIKATLRWWQGDVVQGEGSPVGDLTSGGHFSSWKCHGEGMLGIWH